MSSAVNIVIQLSVFACGQKNPPQPCNTVIIIWQNLKANTVGRRSNCCFFFFLLLLEEVLFLHSLIQLFLPFPFFTDIFAEKMMLSSSAKIAVRKAVVFWKIFCMLLRGRQKGIHIK